MAVVKVLEIIAESPKSWEDAVQEAVKETAKTVRGIQSVWVQDFKAVVKNNKVVGYRANCKISFTVES
ncbi:MAG: dodecin domain-containing protein [Thermaceae bacterium]|nr:dodecin domain-containing protein [Thermaceae bacterium]